MKKPNIKLTRLEKTAVNVPTRESYDELMRVFESANWTWCTKDKPTKGNIWEMFENETCILVFGKDLGYNSKKAYGNLNIISPEEFYTKQEIDKGKREEINNYFNERKNFNCRLN